LGFKRANLGDGRAWDAHSDLRLLLESVLIGVTGAPVPIWKGQPRLARAFRRLNSCRCVLWACSRLQ